MDDALDVLRRALVEYLTALPRTSRRAYGSADLQALLMAFIDRLVELVLPRRVRTLAFTAKDARNEVAHYTGVMAPEDALRHLSNIRQLLKDLDARSAFIAIDRLYCEQVSNSNRCVGETRFPGRPPLSRLSLPWLSRSRPLDNPATWRMASTAHCTAISTSWSKMNGSRHFRTSRSSWKGPCPVQPVNTDLGGKTQEATPMLGHGWMPVGGRGR